MRWLSSVALIAALLSFSTTHAQLSPVPGSAGGSTNPALEPVEADTAGALGGGSPAKEPLPVPLENLAAAAAADDTIDDGKPTTLFNNKRVPPIIDLSGKTFHEDIAKGYWLVDSFSPYCHHCKSLAPKYQTIHEFYYTSDPQPVSSETSGSKTSFSEYYNLKFAALDCVAFGTTCREINVQSFPTLTLFKDGKAVKTSTGDRSIALLSQFIEECLDIIRPGSRPEGGLKQLPAAGAHEVVAERWTPVGGTNLKSTVEETGADAVAPVGPGLFAPKKPTQPRHAPNANGTSVPLTAEMFEREVRKSLNPWFIKFYVPWCKHCQRLSPSWAEMAKDAKDKLDIGEVNCDVEKNLCRDHGVRSYPALMYFRGPERIEYEGLRGVGDLISWTDKAVAATDGVMDITLEEFQSIESTEPVIFLYFYDVATTSEDFMALERIPLHLIGRAKLFKSNDPKLIKHFKITTWPKLLVSRSGKVMYFDWLMPQEIRNVGKVLDWMRSVWLPLVPELTAANARDVLDGTFAVLGILNRDRPEEMAISQRELLNAATDWIDRQAQQIRLEREELRDAKQLRIEEAEDRNDQRALRDAKLIRIDMNEIRRKEVRFAWVDGIFWERWIRTSFGITVRDGERVIINDEDNRLYWDHTITGNPIVPSRTSILETLPKVVASPPKLVPKPNGSSVRVYLFRVRSFLTSHPWIAFGLPAIILLIIAVAWLRRRKGMGNSLPGVNGGWGSGNGHVGGWRKSGFGNTGAFFQINNDGHAGRLLGGGLPNGKAD